jgi:hypothetical protein
MSSISKPLNLSNMYMNTTERIVSAFTAKELKVMVMALAAYNKLDKRDNRTDLMEKLVNGFLMANDLENTEVIRVKPNSKAPMGTAEYKAYEAMYESDVRAHS